MRRGRNAFTGRRSARRAAQRLNEPLLGVNRFPPQRSRIRADRRGGAVGPVSGARHGARRRPRSAQGLVVELGPGTGPVTKALIARGVARDRLVLVEYDPYFCKLLSATLRAGARRARRRLCAARNAGGRLTHAGRGGGVQPAAAQRAAGAPLGCSTTRSS